MVFSSGVFLFVFLPVLLVIYYALRGRTARNYVLLATSLLFYAWGEPLFVFIMIAAILVNWYLVFVMDMSTNKKFWLVLAILLDAALLGIFKYASFITSNIAALTGNNAIRVNIALPIGISFFTFQMMSYVFDVYYKTSKPQKNVIYFIFSAVNCRSYSSLQSD